MKKNLVKRIIMFIIVVACVLCLGGCGLNSSIRKLAEQRQQQNESENNESNTFFGDGYELTYGDKWKKASATANSNEKIEVLSYNDELYLSPIGVSALSEMEKQLNIDFKNYSDQKKLYEEFYKNWNKGDYSIDHGVAYFKLLKGNIYYASMGYKRTIDNKVGKNYIVVSKDNNIVITFMSDTTKSSSKDDSKIIDLLKTINITKKYDNELASSLNQMSAWNRYSSARKGTLGIKKELNGGWKILSNSDSYWVFKDNEFWWYKSQNDLNDNYWYGKTKILTGKEGIKSVGLSEDNLNRMLANNSGKVTANDVYTVIFTPSKIISNGVDKSSTNITGEDWHMVWILVDHGSEGIEAQVLNVKNTDTSYYVKVKD